ncbi:unnamed protein product [Acanthoscelides obtectus]|uniref:RING-type E3 ubiquitin transferase n=1 Tax=Acanthoscelides obtectus TaxID=200917 RepID=A0A9P0LX68_ACAOB|nr:unnamed protein product [Acanthoscelides obtectus]CAK1636554.1 E3 ubiquitin-protein ligase rnf168 [Acanthoscelides obtectus]
MASKRGAQKKNQTAKSKDFSTLVLSDVLCPVCRNILIEPVTLPCSHAFCFSCFRGIVNNTNLICPLCRIRMTSWYRKTGKACKLLDEDLWKAIKAKFPQQVANKLCGIDDVVEEEKMIVVARPGEIRKEYEDQKHQEEEEIRKLKEAEARASEDLIQKLKEEDDYEKAVMEEKLRMDEIIAKKLAEEIALEKFKENTNKKQGSLDRFLVKDNETITSQDQHAKKKPINNFYTKEYTCRILCLDDKKSEAHKKVFSPIIKKKIQQIQKIVDMDVSDSSDCFESEMRYFKPIDHRFPSQRKPPIKITPKKIYEKADVKILSPSGTVNFQSNLQQSAFIRISPTFCITAGEKSKQQNSSKSKRLHSDEYLTPNKKMIPNDHYRKSPVLNNSRKSKKQLFGKFYSDDSSSPPFYGFERVSDCTEKKKNDKTVLGDSKLPKINGTSNEIQPDLQNKLLQEKADLEYAMKLQEQFDKSIYTRNTRRTVASKKQTTLDNMICCRVK